MADKHFEITGTDELARRLAKMGDAALPATEAGLSELAEEIIADSAENYVPVDEGILRSTGHVQPPARRGNEVSVTLGFGGPAAPYAAVVHENLAASHAVGQAKYLETPFMQAAPSLPERLARLVEAAFRRLAGG